MRLRKIIKPNLHFITILKHSSNETQELFLFFGLLTIRSQTATSITNLQTPALDENSGLFYNNNIITHNDSGGQANLYEINASTVRY
jgi:hypothetical protein